nr:hypothetical protein [Tanacetum cinerariifolium]
MTWSSTKELITPFENPERVFRSKMRLFETRGLMESSSLELGLFFDIEEHSGEETIEIMTETMEQYMSKTRGNYGGSEHKDANEHIKKFLKIVDLFHIPEVTQDQVMLRVFPMSSTEPQVVGSGTNHQKMEEINNFQQEPDESLFRAWERFKELLMKCSQHYLTDMQKVILFYNGLDVPTRQILDSKARSTKTSNKLAAIQAQLNNIKREIKKVNEKVYAAQEESLTKFMVESAKRHEENSNIIKEIRASTDSAIRNQGASIKTLEIQIGQMSKVLQERGIRGTIRRILRFGKWHIDPCTADLAIRKTMIWYTLKKTCVELV